MRFVNQIKNYGYSFAMAVQRGPYRHGVMLRLRACEHVPLKGKVGCKAALKAWAKRSMAGQYRLQLVRHRRRSATA